MIAGALFKAQILETVSILIGIGVFGRWNANTGQGSVDVGIGSIDMRVYFSIFLKMT